MKYLGIDYGLSNIGLAMADEETKMALVFATFEEKDLEQQLTAVQQIVIEEEIGTVVVGFPINMQGKKSEQTVQTLNFIEELKKRLSIPVFSEDERLSTKLAKRWAHEADSKDEHSLAAVAILQTFLERK